MTFCLNSFEKPLDLTTKDRLLLYNNANKGLEKEDRFEESKSKYPKFIKLIGKTFKRYRMMEILKVSTTWEAVEFTSPLQDGIIDLFESNNITKKQVDKQADRVWPDKAHSATTPQKYCKVFA